MKQIKRQKGFTLAEVLITTSIIGIIASILLKTVMANMFKAEMKQKLTVAQSMLSESLANMKVESPSNSLYLTYSDYSTGTYPYCSFVTDVLQNFKTPLNKTTTYNNTNYAKSYSNQKYDILVAKTANCTGTDSGAFTLQNGMVVLFYINWYIPYITIDLNGSKKPNRHGFDVFVFRISENDQIAPFFYNDGGSDRFRCEANGSGQDNGYNCAKWALEDKCPDGSSQGYWECLPN